MKLRHAILVSCWVCLQVFGFGTIGTLHSGNADVQQECNSEAFNACKTRVHWECRLCHLPSWFLFFVSCYRMLFGRLDRILSAPSGSKFSLAWYRQNVRSPRAFQILRVREFKIMYRLVSPCCGSSCPKARRIAKPDAAFVVARSGNIRSFDIFCECKIWVWSYVWSSFS